MPRWSQLSTYKELRGTTMQYLKGELSESAWMGGSVDQETVPLLGDLRKINALGLQTTQGQPGKPRCHEVKYNNYSQGYNNNVQREYLNGLFPRSLANEFIKHLVQHGLFVVKKQYVLPELKHSASSIHADPKLWKDHMTVDNFQDIVLTKWQSHPLQDKVTSQEWKENTRFRKWTLTVPSEEISILETKLQPKLVSWVKTHIVELFICAPEFCKDEMLQIILSTLKKMQPKMARLPQMSIIT
jgi:hypothetical protein